MDQKVIDLYDEYTHKPLSRSDFLKRLALLAGGAAAASALLPLIEVNYAIAAAVAPDDPAIVTERVVYPGKTGEVKAYLARPKGVQKAPAVIVIHENRGLNPHIEDVARRAAVAGFLAIAPDGLSPAGGTPEDLDKARELIQTLNREDTVANFVAAVAFATKHPHSTGKVGCVGFCWGGAMANQLAVHAPDLKAAVPFYGRQPAMADVPKIKAALLLHYAATDQGINAGIAEYEAALKAANVNYTLHMYENTQHAFHNDTAAGRYDEAAAKLAWQRTIAFFKEKLKA